MFAGLTNSLNEIFVFDGLASTRQPRGPPWAAKHFYLHQC